MDSLAKVDGLFSAFVFSATNLTGWNSLYSRWQVNEYMVLGGGLTFLGFDQPMYSSLILESEENLERHIL